jgi:ABC-type multidrug transport system ATPase subunit
MSLYLQVLFLDEPTTGLDSSMANEVCVMLQEIARSGRAVVAILHSPTAFGFSLFDQLMMLDDKGRTTYFGPQHKIQTTWSTSDTISREMYVSTS